MLRLNIKLDSIATQEELARVGARLQDLTPLHEKLGARLELELKAHFARRNSEPNKQGWFKSNWWAGVATATSMTAATAKGATVAIAHDEGFAYHLRGGTIRARERSAMTIPKVESAKGLRVKEWEEKNSGRYESSGDEGRVIFRPRGTRVLAAKPRGQKEGFEVIYVLAKSVEIPKDPEALPAEGELQSKLNEEARDWIDLQLKKAKGGTA